MDAFSSERDQEEKVYPMKWWARGTVLFLIELDLIINYDIKYRMGREAEAGDPQEDADQ